MNTRLITGNCLEVMKKMDENSIDSIVTDPPYGLKFMGKDWDNGVPGKHFWDAAISVAKPGAHLLAFGGTRTFHRLACAIEDAGWEIRDTLGWIYGSGFPKSHDVSKSIDRSGGKDNSWFIDYCLKIAFERKITRKQLTNLFPSKNGKSTGWLYNKSSHNQDLTPEQFNKLKDFLGLPFKDIESAKRDIIGIGESGLTSGTIANFSGKKEFDITSPATDAARQWYGWGTALKPAWEPIILARKPPDGTVAANVLKWGTGAINVDGCRVEYSGKTDPRTFGGKWKTDRAAVNIYEGGYAGKDQTVSTKGRWPANLIHDGSQMVLELFPNSKDGVAVNRNRPIDIPNEVYGKGWKHSGKDEGYGQSGSAARFFYCAKASRKEREMGCGALESGPVAINTGKAHNVATLGRETKYSNNHPTVKPLSLMRYLCRLVTPPNGIVLDPFMGSCSTGVAAIEEGFNFTGIELSEEYIKIAEARINNAKRKIK